MEQDKILEKLINERSRLTSEINNHDSIIENDGSIEIVPDSLEALLIDLRQKLKKSELHIIQAQIDVCMKNPMRMIGSVSFGVAVEALKMGWPIAREGWFGPHSLRWIIRQVPSDIDSTIIPKMQSLPIMAKKRIMKTNAYIRYANQCLIYDEATGTANSWAPSAEDILAEDWFVIEP